ncbi:hypothetical protein KMT30_01295 [Streptomyces sp. IBSBF 2953]|uniref:hypothetical protein n=1 Tax=Streptomyces TaxID=1883 RepID=UPI002119FD7C|nr:hypothetical protein [Streptomyces scabiei]MCQ9177705.1 hypothetical protein [Streptomyces hayashii]MDX3115708.1 hypothetical protein [Streptomyces scabiei]
MAELRSWRVTDGDLHADAPVVLAVDFTATGRPEAAFAALARGLKTGHAVWESLAPPPGEESGMTAQDYLRRWTGELRSRDVTVSHVFGYCASSVFALALAELVGRRQHTPSVVLFDPTAINGETVLRYGFRPVIDALAGVLGPDDVADAYREGEQAVADAPELDALAEQFVRIYRTYGSAAFERLGLRADRVEELVGWFRSYLHYVVAAGRMPVVTGLPDVRVVRSSDLPGNLDIRADHELRFDVDHAELLGHPEVAEAVRGLLG